MSLERRRPAPIFLQLISLLLLLSWKASTRCNALNDNSTPDDEPTKILEGIIARMNATSFLGECALTASQNDLKGCGVIKQQSNNNKSNGDIIVDDPVCSIYLAPSSIEGAGWGLYTSRNLTRGTKLDGFNDPVIPINDHYKVLPYRSRSRFTNWLGYIWPKGPDAFYKSTTASFPMIPANKYKAGEGISYSTIAKFYDTGIDDYVSVFTPGLASMLNSHPELKNVRGTGVNEFVVAEKEVPAGSELFMHYGADWHVTYDHIRSAEKEEHLTLEYYNEHMRFNKLPTEQDKRSMMNSTTMRKQSDNDKIATLKTSKARKTKEHTKISYSSKVLPSMPIQTMEWLHKNGICMDKITSKPTSSSSSSLNAAFSRTKISRGNVITATPMLALKREDLIIYDTNKGVSKKSPKFLNLEKVIGKEDILNYCYGHNQSDLLLLPYGPFVNHINHDSKNPNAYVRWAKNHEDTQALLQKHPIDVVNSTSKLLMEFVALRDIQKDERITIDYGKQWEDAWNQHNQRKSATVEDFQQNIGVPEESFFPAHWLDTHLDYEIANVTKQLEPGELQPLKWKHNGVAVTRHAYRLGLPKGFSEHILGYAKKLGIVDLYHDLLERNTLPESDDWYAFDTKEDGQWFAQRFKTKDWAFNMHYVATWSERARMSFLRELGRAGFGVGLESMGRAFGLQNMTCFHVSFMGVSEAENSFTHTDVYATDEKGFNIIFPIVLVNGSKPELDIQSDDANVVTAVNYEFDTAVVMGDYGYHKTSPNMYDDKGKIRIVVGMYCGEINDANANQMAHVYNGEDPAPFMNKFDKAHRESHWSPETGVTLPE